MATSKAPKQWQLTKNETITSFENWRQNLVYTLSLDVNFAPYLSDMQWGKKSASRPNRDLQDDSPDVLMGKTAAQKSAQLDMMLGMIANYCTVISRNTITRNATSLNDIWQKIRLHFGFQSSGAHFLDLASIKREPDERPEDLFQRLTAFFEDNLLSVNCGISHHGQPVDTDEDLTPSLENTITYLWLSLLNPALPGLVKQKYGAELRNKTLASLKPEISQSLDSLQEEIKTIEDTRVLRAATSGSSRQLFKPNHFQTRPKKFCVLCKAERRPCNTHNLEECKHLPDVDRKKMAHSRLVCGVSEEDPDLEEPYLSDSEDLNNSSVKLVSEEIPPIARRVDVQSSPYLRVFYGNHPVELTLDTGATSNMIKDTFVATLGIPLKRTTQLAKQADGETPLDVVGEVHCQFTRGHRSFKFDALVVKKLDVNILAGTPFLSLHDIYARPSLKQVIIDGSETVNYGRDYKNSISVRRAQSYILRAPSTQSVLPGDFIEITAPPDFPHDFDWALEPRFDSNINKHSDPYDAWPPAQEVTSVAGSIRIANSTSSPITIRKHDQFCKITEISEIQDPPVQLNHPTSCTPKSLSSPPYSQAISLDPDNLFPNDIRAKFSQLHLQYDSVFNPSVPKYNGYSGNIQAVVNIGPALPPQRKGRLPHYNNDTMTLLQAKFDELEKSGVFAKPEEVGITVEYLNLSFLVKKPSGGHRLVTSFGSVAKYCKPQPSVMPNVDSVLRNIAKWKYIIQTDLRQSFFQIPLAKSSMKYCGVATPFKGIRVYTRSAMGMPGSETVLEELLSRVLGDLIQEGFVAKLADDLLVGGDSPSELLTNWSKVLAAIHKNNLGLSASKTIIGPNSTNVLGWIWRSGTITASPHRVACLASVQPPDTVRGLRSFIGAYKVLSRVLKGYSDLLHPLDQAVAGKQSMDKIIWSDTLLNSFQSAQRALKDTKTITIPKSTDQLWLVTDGSPKQCGIGATLYVQRNNNLQLAGFYNTRLKRHQQSWLPCEIEALAIASALNHFAPYLIQSKLPPQILTDSKPCVQAFQKLSRGEFSASSRISTFLTCVSQYGAHVSHIAGKANLSSDFSSRNPIPCPSTSCQICKFVEEIQDSVVRNISVDQVLQGIAKMPFMSRVAWQATQQECPDLRRVYSHLKQGTRPSKKITDKPDLKRYLHDVVISHDGLLIVRDVTPFQPLRERIVIPRFTLFGLLTALHIRLDHPSQYQLKQVFARYFYALDADAAIKNVCSSCHLCQSLKSIPNHLLPQSTSSPPDKIGAYFVADVMRRYRQMVLLIRESVSSYSFTCFIENEQRSTLVNAILCICSEFTTGGSTVTIRVDPHPSFVSLAKDPHLQDVGISLDIGDPKNVNKNPIAESAIKELGLECLHLSPEGGPISELTLARATANMNSRIRWSGLSAREIWTQRDQITGEQLPIEDRQLILTQHLNRTYHHGHSALSKATISTQGPHYNLHIGDLVYINSDRDKARAREKYLICESDDQHFILRKFSQSQFRSKIYRVKREQCYPIIPTVLGDRISPVRGLEDSIHPDTSGPGAIVPHPTLSAQLPDLNTQLNLPNQELPILEPEPPPCSVSPDKDITPTPVDTPIMPPLPIDITHPPGPVSPDSSSQVPSPEVQPPPPPQDDTQLSVDITAPRRSSRTRKPPKWQTSGSWVMDT